MCICTHIKVNTDVPTNGCMITDSESICMLDMILLYFACCTSQPMLPLEANLAFNKKMLDSHRWHITKLEQINRKLSNDARSANGANLVMGESYETSLHAANAM